MIEYLRRFFGLKRESPATNEPVGWASLAWLLEDLELIAIEHEEIFDTDVREQMWSFLEARFIRLNKNASLPESFGMFTDEGNDKVREAFARNTENLDTIIDIFSLDTYEKRKITFKNARLATRGGNRLDDFFGAP